MWRLVCRKQALAVSTYGQCLDCPGQVIVGEYSAINVPRVDVNGFPELGPDGRVRMIRLRLPNHRVRLIAQGRDTQVDRNGVPLERWTPAPEAQHSVLDPTGLSHAECEHGIKEHPLGLTLRYGGRSWIRSKYLDVGRGLGVSCPVCRGEPAPDDMTTPRSS